MSYGPPASKHAKGHTAPMSVRQKRRAAKARRARLVTPTRAAVVEEPKPVTCGFGWRNASGDVRRCTLPPHTRTTDHRDRSGARVAHPEELPDPFAESLRRSTVGVLVSIACDPSLSGEERELATAEVARRHVEMPSTRVYLDIEGNVVPPPAESRSAGVVTSVDVERGIVTVSTLPDGEANEPPRLP